VPPVLIGFFENPAPLAGLPINLEAWKLFF
jgi:hypothetical protein